MSTGNRCGDVECSLSLKVTKSSDIQSYTREQRNYVILLIYKLENLQLIKLALRYNSIPLKVRHVFAFIANAQTSNRGACFCGYTALSHRCIGREPINLWVSGFISSSATTIAWDKHDLKQVHTRTHIPHTRNSHLNANSLSQCTHNVQ